MQVRFLGYNTVVRTVDIGTPQALDVALSVAATEIGQVVVTGVSAATEMRRSPIPTTVVDHTRLNQAASTNAVDAIAHTPGLSQITTGPGISKVSRFAARALNGDIVRPRIANRSRQALCQRGMRATPSGQ
jgi:iron complex outermembrane receptor protein